MVYPSRCLILERGASGELEQQTYCTEVDPRALEGSRKSNQPREDAEALESYYTMQKHRYIRLMVLILLELH
jgi:hypothetical protein